jgi:Uncharacterised nucleotidyltransferase
VTFPDGEETGRAPYEEELLSTCLRSAGLVSLRRAGPPRVDDWEEARRAMARHGLTPLAAVALPAGGPWGDVPPPVIESFKRARHRSVITHQNALSVLERIDPAFRRAEVSYAVLKGPHLYEALYADRFPRFYGDIDLLVRRSDLDRALGILADVGFRPSGNALSQALVRRGHFHLVLLPDRAGLPKLELHWSLVDRANLYRMEDETVLARAVDQRAPRGVFRVLSVEDTFLYLCLHVAKHGLLNAIGLRSGHSAEWFCGRHSGNRLLSYVDLDLLLRKEMEGMNWDAVRARAEEWNVGSVVTETLEVMRFLLPDSPAPVALERLGRGAPVREAGGWLARGLRTRAGVRVVDLLMKMNADLVVRPARLLFLGGLLFPSPGELREYYRGSPWPLPVLYLRHPWHILRKLLT